MVSLAGQNTGLDLNNVDPSDLLLTLVWYTRSVHSHQLPTGNGDTKPRATRTDRANGRQARNGKLGAQGDDI